MASRPLRAVRTRMPARSRIWGPGSLRGPGEEEGTLALGGSGNAVKWDVSSVVPRQGVVYLKDVWSISNGEGQVVWSGAPTATRKML